MVVAASQVGTAVGVEAVAEAPQGLIAFGQ